jgi:type VI secretion system protein ImpB
MSKEGSVAPKERVNITYKPAAGEVQQQVELPFKVLMLGEFTGRPDERPVEERTPISVDKDNFNQVMAEQKLAVEATVPNRLSSEPNAELHVSLNVRSLSDFTPDGIAAQVPELQKLLELRQALIALKGPLGNVPAFRKKIQTLLEDPSARERIMKELGLGNG